MNRLDIIGNVTGNPELKATPSGHTVCSFGVAVNERRGGRDETTFFRVSAWNKLAETCQTYLQKGKKVRVTGPVSARGYSKSDGTVGVSIEINANDVEFLSPRETYEQQERAAIQQENMTAGAIAVETDELPF
jgi:single-strand DNA-binding protein